MTEARQRLPLFLVRQTAEQPVRIDLDTGGRVDGRLFGFVGVFPVGLRPGDRLDQADQHGGASGTAGGRLAGGRVRGPGSLA